MGINWRKLAKKSMKKAAKSGSKSWLAVGIGATVFDMFAVIRRPKTKVLYRSKLPVGQSMTISHKKKV